MDEVAAREYSESISQIGEGWWRQIAWAHQQGIPKALGISTREWAEKYHGYLKMVPPDRREAVAELAADGLSNRAIADVLGVDKETVNRDVRDANAPPEESAHDENKGASDANASPEFFSSNDDDWQEDPPKPTKADPKEEAISQARRSFTHNMLDALISLDRPAEDGKNCAELYDPSIAARTGQEITPQKLRRAAAFLEACAHAMETK